MISIVIQDQKPPYSPHVTEHVVILIYFIITPVCIRFSWTLYLLQMTLLNLLLYMLTANYLNLSWDLKVALKELTLPALIGAFSYMVFNTILNNKSRKGVLFVFQLSLLPLLALGSYYIFLVVGSFGEGAWWIFIALMFGCTALSIILFVSGLLYIRFQTQSSNQNAREGR